MPKDYAKFVPPQMDSSDTQTGRIGIFLFATFVLALSVAISYFIYEKKVMKIPGEKPSIPGFLSYAASSVLHHHKVQPISHTQNKMLAKTNPSPEVEFDFYNDLPNEQMTVTEDEKTKTQTVKVTASINSLFNPDEVSKQLSDEVSQAVKPNTETTTSQATQTYPTATYQYVLQLGAFETESGAKRLQEALSSVGFETQVIENKSNNQALYLVQQGPFTSKELAKTSQEQLQKRGIVSILRQV